jgi:hypothetical protein
MKTEVSIMARLTKMVKDTASAAVFTQMVLTTRVNGKLICLVDMEVYI